MSKNKDVNQQALTLATENAHIRNLRSKKSIEPFKKRKGDVDLSEEEIKKLRKKSDKWQKREKQ